MDDMTLELLRQYGIVNAEAMLLRHNENRTYKVIDSSNSSAYLLRVHDPVTVNLEGIQHSREGIESELQLLEALALGTEFIVQVPVMNLCGHLVSEFELDGRTLHFSLLNWIDGHNMTKEDLSSPSDAYNLGAMVAILHAFFDTYDKITLANRPGYGIPRTEKMLAQIRRGVEFELFSDQEFDTVEQTLTLIIDRLKAGRPEMVKQGLIHADLNMSNILVTSQGKYVFIDYCLFGFGYRLFDVAMAALNAPSETREQVVKGYLGQKSLPAEIYSVIEGFMLSAVLGYYAFVMENKAVHPWIRERMPQFCDTRCAPFLKGESIFLSF